MATYGEIKSNIATMLSRSDLTTQIQDAVLSAIRYYEEEPFWFNEDTFTKTLSASQSLYTLTGSLSLITSILNAKLTYSGTENTVEIVQHQELDEIDANSSTGQPTKMARWGNNLRVYPSPSSAYTLTVRAYRKYTTLSASTDTNAWTQNADELISARALWWVSITKTRNYEVANAAKSIEENALKKLRNKSGLAVATGKIKSTNF